VRGKLNKRFADFKLLPSIIFLTLFISYLLTHFLITPTNEFNELYLYNSLPILLLVPFKRVKISQLLIATSWASASFLSTAAFFHTFEVSSTIINSLYSLFYISLTFNFIGHFISGNSSTPKSQKKPRQPLIKRLSTINFQLIASIAIPIQLNNHDLQWLWRLSRFQNLLPPLGNVELTHHFNLLRLETSFNAASDFLLIICAVLFLIFARNLALWVFLLGAFALVMGDYLGSEIVFSHNNYLTSLSNQLWLMAIIIFIFAFSLPMPNRATYRFGFVTSAFIVLINSLSTLLTSNSNPIDQTTLIANWISFSIASFIFLNMFTLEIWADRVHADSLRDSLTGLENRKSFYVRCDELWGKELIVGIFDLDKFKEINDKYGHSMGDNLLIAISLRIQKYLPAGVILARLGGDEFALLCLAQDIDIHEFTALVCNSFSVPFVINGLELLVSSSFGYVHLQPKEYEGEGLTPQMALHRADEAMYFAKVRHQPIMKWSKEISG
jgi:diguanylate cyclase (GGDEF)-like protein